MTAKVIPFAPKPKPFDPLAFAPDVPPFDRSKPTHVRAWNTICALGASECAKRER